jgi:hypothetical protein
MRIRPHYDRLHVTRPGRLVEHYIRPSPKLAASRARAPVPIVVIGSCGADHGTNETTDESTISTTDHITQHSAGTSANQRTSKLVGRHCVITKGGKSGHQQDWGDKFRFHDLLLGLGRFQLSQPLFRFRFHRVSMCYRVFLTPLRITVPAHRMGNKREAPNRLNRLAELQCRLLRETSPCQPSSIPNLPP